jgi:hypothetical protein
MLNNAISQLDCVGKGGLCLATLLYIARVTEHYLTCCVCRNPIHVWAPQAGHIASKHIVLLFAGAMA